MICHLLPLKGWRWYLRWGTGLPVWAGLILKKQGLEAQATGRHGLVLLPGVFQCPLAYYLLIPFPQGGLILMGGGPCSRGLMAARGVEWELLLLRVKCQSSHAPALPPAKAGLGLTHTPSSLPKSPSSRPEPINTADHKWLRPLSQTTV